VRGLEDVEKRVAALEKRVDKLEGKPEQPDTPTAEKAKEAGSTTASRASKQPKAAESKPSSKP
jgi:hypothetical protein